MFARSTRLSHTKDIEAVLKKGKIIFTPFFNIKYLPNKLNYPRFCLIISNKTAPHAAIRNRTRRRLRPIITKHLAQFHNSDHVFLLKPASTIAKSQDLELALLKALQ